MSISGTGKRTADGRFMEDPQLYRTIAAPGDANILPATIEAVAEVMNSKEHVDYGPSGDDNTGRRLEVFIEECATKYSGAAAEKMKRVGLPTDIATGHLRLEVPENPQD